ncbi:hypothetical protein QN277_005665 [Acacia crassicarpa]|uniref:F-box domain-containing protein n=1 Tax=Acacia crassicarpa TaxID=499986 RepID=A0AAE1IXL7_9FABA|nr:hypothetical protein QN277_005665 [Acacia crassicarpa]
MATGCDNLYLPPEMITDILKRLRVKCLVRFQSVCKDWRNLLKSPYFIEEHYHHSILNNCLLVCRICHRTDGIWPPCLLHCEKETVEVERLPVMDSLGRLTQLVGSSNGLLCVKLGYEEYYPLPSLLLLNPATREVRQVPKSTNDHGRSRFCRVDSGFGYNHVVRDYKIVTIHRVRHRNEYDLACVDLVDVFSLRKGSWKEVEFGIIRFIDLYSQPVTVNGAMFWSGWHRRDLRGVVVSFDLKTEVFTLISIPSSSPIYDNNLGVYENKVMGIPYSVHEFELWVLEEAGSCASGKSWVWTKKYRTSETSPLFPHFPLLRNELACYNAKGDSGLLFNTTTNSKLKKFTSSSADFVMVEKLVYVESLVSMCDMYIE